MDGMRVVDCFKHQEILISHLSYQFQSHIQSHIQIKLL